MGYGLRGAALGAVALLLGTTGCQTHGLLGAVTPDYDVLATGPGDRTRGFPIRLPRPEFLIQPKKTPEGKIEGWQVLVDYVTDERAVYWVNIDPGFLHSSTEFKLTFGGAPDTKDFAPGTLSSLTHSVKDETGGVVNLIAEFASLGLGIYTLAAADRPADFAIGGFVTAQAIANDPLRTQISADQEEASAALEAIQAAGGDLQRMGFREDAARPFATPAMQQAFRDAALGAERPLAPFGGAGEPTASHLEELKQVLGRLVDERWTALHTAHEALFDRRGVTKRWFLDLAAQAPAFGAFAEPLRERLRLAAGDEAWTAIRAQAKEVYYTVLGLAVIMRLADTEEWRAKRIRLLYQALKDAERDYVVSGAATKPTDGYLAIERKLYLALRMQSELDERLALEAFLRSPPYVETKGEALIAQMKEARAGVNAILADFQARVESFIGDHKLLQPTAPPATTKDTGARTWLDQEVERPRVLYFPERRPQPCGDCPPRAQDAFLAQWAEDHLRACGELDDLADGEMIIVLERGAPSRTFVPHPANGLYTEVTSR